MIGNVLIGAALAGSIVLAILCILQNSPKYIKSISAGNFAMIALASLYLWTLLLTDDFTCPYVASYSSASMPTVYKVSAFWAGQEGSFLLWLLFHAIAGLVLSYRQTPTKSLMIYNVLQAMLAVLVLTKSPFPFEELGVTITDGVGLNPLLQNPWTAIHPPLISA